MFNLFLSVANLSSVVAGEMTAAKQFPYIYKGKVTDANKITVSGIYKMESGSQNAPESFGLLIVYTTDGYYSVQDFHGMSTGRSYTRRKTSVNGSWTSWYRIDNFGYNTLAELASGVATALNNPLTFKEVLNTSDLNDLRTITGIWGIQGSVTNKPVNAGLCMVLKSGGLYPQCVQLFLGYQGTIHYRVYNENSVWTDWREL